MCMEIKERFYEFIKYKRLSKRAFQASIGVSASYIQNIANTISLDVLRRIEQEYPELNTEWLLSGNGEMIRAGYIANAKNGRTAVAGNGNTINEEAGEFFQLLKKKDEQIDRLLTIIEKMTNNN